MMQRRGRGCDLRVDDLPVTGHNHDAGHASTAITDEVYRHEIPAALRNATEQVAKRIFER